MRNIANRPLLDLIFDGTTFLLALGSCVALILGGSRFVGFVGFVAGIAAVSGWYAIRSLILWKKHHHIVMHDAWIHQLRELTRFRIMEMDLHHGPHWHNGHPIQIHSRPIDFQRKINAVNWKRDGF